MNMLYINHVNHLFCTIDYTSEFGFIYSGIYFMNIVCIDLSLKGFMHVNYIISPTFVTIYSKKLMIYQHYSDKILAFCLKKIMNLSRLLFPHLFFSSGWPMEETFLEVSFLSHLSEHFISAEWASGTSWASANENRMHRETSVWILIAEFF